ncbi:hypothetical protein [Spirosoma endophyticum]|uniref:Uncharacterized protein n=1 Tax=Spirosoma endophyticum TaxID=662367 RepID=A0A1I1ZCP6_9BACT|nr:hypothetical protein [Spirosoma endophyticum]SFE28263.1 hypothetical protein SAMN05216167_11252 [Spirosoma endophyticum]
MKKLFIFFVFLALTSSCKKNEPDPSDSPIANQSNRSVLTYTTNFPGTYQVTDYDANGIPTLAKVSVFYPFGVTPTGEYTSSVKLEYDTHLRIKKTVQIFNELGNQSCCPGSAPVTDPDRQLINEYEYQGNTANITYEIAYTVNAKKGEKLVVSERFRTFTETGMLTQEKLGTKPVYEARYDAYDNPVKEILYSADGAPVVTREWDYVYDTNHHLLSRRVKGSALFENNTYDNQGRITRRVTNMTVMTPFRPSYDMGRLIDYSFDRHDERGDMNFMFFQFTGQWTQQPPQVLTYTYTEEETLIINTAYSFWKSKVGIDQPEFNFDQVPKEELFSIKVTKWHLNKWNKLSREEFTNTYVSEQLKPEQRGTVYASDLMYSYDERGNLVGSEGTQTNFYDRVPAKVNSLTARYKNF